MRALAALLLRLLPGGFRERFGPEVLDQVEADWRRARARGRLAAVRFALSTVADLARTGLAERAAPSWTPHRPAERDEGRDSMTSQWITDVRRAARSLGRARGFTAVAVATLGLAIGVAVGVFAIADAVLLDPLPYDDADRLVAIAASAPGSDMPEEFGVSAEFLVQYREESSLLEDVALYNSFTHTLRADDQVERIGMTASSPSLFRTLGVRPVLGRLPAPEEENAMVVSHALWTSLFGNDPGVIGRTFEAAGAPRTVVGVMGPRFRFPGDRELLWLTAPIRAEGMVPGRFGLRLVGRVTPGTEPAALADELTRLARRLPERFGGSPGYARMIEQHRAVVRPLEEELLGSTAGSVKVLLGAAALVLLIACANVANLFAVRAEARQQDLAVRRALGAGRRRLVRAQMAEALVVAGLAGAFAVVLAWLTVPVFVQAAPDGIPRLGDVTLSSGALAFAVVVSFVAALACGLLPALRGAAPDLGRLRDAGRGAVRGRNWQRDGLVVAQTALALVLLIGSGLLVRSFRQLQAVDPGYDTRDLFTFQIAPEGDELDSPEAYARFHLAFRDRLAALPGVEAVGLVENVPIDEGVATTRYLTEAMGGDQEAAKLVGFTWATGNYFRTMGVPLLQGRAFTPADDLAGSANVMVSRSAAELLWPGEDPLGRRLRRSDADAWDIVVGVTEDVLQDGPRSEAVPMVYYPLVAASWPDRAISSPGYVVRTGRAASIAPEIRALVREVAPNAPMYRTYTMEGLVAGSMAHLSFTMLLLGVASVLALVLGAVGLYGVLSYVVAQRTREIGVRMALGAGATRVRRMVVGEGARVVVLGVALGLIGAAAATRVLGSLLFGVESLDAGTFAAMSASMLAVGLVASWVPAWRASATDPVESLRE